MKTFLVLFGVTLILTSYVSFSQWSEPAQLTFGPDDDGEVALGNSWDMAFFPRKEWLAFSRTSSDGKHIHLLHTVDYAYDWVDTLYSVTIGVPGMHEHPSIAEWSTWFGGQQHLMLVWQCMEEGKGRIMHSYNPGSGWSPPLSVTSDTMNNLFPHVAARDSGFGVVWELDGTIQYAEFNQGVWSAPSAVTPPGDSSNHRPRLRFLGYPPNQPPIAVWEKRTSNSSQAIMYSTLSSTGWASPAPVYEIGENRAADLSMLGPAGGYLTVLWQAHQGTRWDIFSRSAYHWNGGITWEPPENISSQVTGNSERPSFTTIPFITENQRSWLWGAGTWMVDSQQVAAVNYPPYYSLLTAAPGAINRDPRVSSGVIDPMFNMRVWCVWRANANGQWKLYGSSIPISLGDVDEDTGLPDKPALHHNYPNPFNPSTTLSFDIQHSTFVILKVFDILGREAAMLVNERKEPGTHRVEFNAEDLPSGVYVFRLQAGEYMASRKMILIR